MADITEVIHRISYEVHDDALQNATKSIQLQIAELDKLNKTLNGYTAALDKLNVSEGKQLDELARKIDATSKQIVRSVTQTEGLLKQSFKGILKGLDIETDAKDAIGKYVAGVKKKFEELGSSAKTVTSGMNKMFTSTSTAATKSGGKTISTLGKLGKSLTSVTGLIDLGVVALSLLAEELLKESEAAKEARLANEEYKGSIEDINAASRDYVASETVRLQQLYRVAQDTNVAYDDRIQAVKDMKAIMPDYLGQIKDEDILNGNAADSIALATTALIAKARATAAYNKVVASAERIEEIKTVQLRKAVSEYADSRATQFGFEGLELTNEDYRKQAKEYIDEYNSGKDIDGINSGEKFENLLSTYNELLDIEEEQTVYQENHLKYLEEYNRLLKERKVIKKDADNDDTKRTNSNPITPPPPKPENQERKPEESFYLPSSQEVKANNENDPRTNTADLNLEEVELSEIAEEQKGLTDKQKENIEKGIDGYEKLAQAAADAYNKILQAQIDALDAEISIRESRVEKAKELAERGNTEALRLEEERLQKTQEKREQFAKRQQAVNAAITVSNAIAAVARAALDGGGFGSAATIAAMIAALAAGYAAVTSLSSGGAEGFADGVVDYNGKGGPRDDKNWVRISSGESVITAEGTKKNRALLEAINQGTALHMIDPSLPIVLPSFKQPDTNNAGQYAATKDLKRLETKLDEVVDAIGDNKLRQNIFFNEQGVGIMTERAINRDRNRWK